MIGELCTSAIGRIIGACRTFPFSAADTSNVVLRGDYGGMDVYVNQLAGSSNHDLFYTNAKVTVSVVLPHLKPLILTDVLSAGRV